MRQFSIASLQSLLQFFTMMCVCTIAAAQSHPQVPVPEAKEAHAASGAGDIYRKASPAVVLIETYNEKGEVSAAGSGFIISTDGKILTNYHVIAHTKQVTIRLANKDAYDAVEVLDIDRRKDIAVIKIKAVDLPFLALGRSGTVEVGDHVFSLSTPLGLLQNTLSDGIVSGIRAGDGYRYFQVTAPISHGSSGGPIFNSNGEVIGIAALTFSEGQNLNFAIPIDYAKGMLASPAQPKSLTAIYEPELDSDKIRSATPERIQSGDEQAQSELKQVGIAGFLERKVGFWTAEDFRRALGEPHGHRFGVGDPMPEIWAYDDPSKYARQVELLFDSATKKLRDYFIYPINVTWEDCKRIWGNKTWMKKNADGSRMYMYKDRRINVLVSNNGTVISLGVYSQP